MSEGERRRFTRYQMHRRLRPAATAKGPHTNKLKAVITGVCAGGVAVCSSADPTPLQAPADPCSTSPYLCRVHAHARGACNGKAQVQPSIDDGSQQRGSDGNAHDGRWTALQVSGMMGQRRGKDRAC